MVLGYMVMAYGSRARYWNMILGYGTGIRYWDMIL